MTHQSAGEPLVLVVEDDSDARELYELMLRASGFRVESAANGVDAVHKARSLRPHLILMDLTLPSLNGWEASRQLKDDAGTRDIPIVALSGNAVEQEGAGVFADALLKPCFPEDLVAHVRRLLESK